MDKRKFLFLPRYSRLGASSRLRTFQYLPLLEEKGIAVKAMPLFNDQYLTELYSDGRISKRNVLICYLKRFGILFTLLKYDGIMIEKELFPYFPAWGEWLISKWGIKYYVDYDDAIFHNYDQHDNSFIRMFLGNKIDKVMSYSHMVFVGNAYLNNRAKLAGAPKVVFLPTVVDATKYLKGNEVKKNKAIKIGWIGSPTTLKYLVGILPALERLKENFAFELVIIGGGRSIGFSGTEKLLPWSEEEEVREINRLDIGIMPLTDTDWEKGKCAYKLIQYMACGLPIVGSPVGVNTEIIKQGVNGFLPANEREWVRCLGQLITDRELRAKMGEAGVKTVQQQYTIQVIFNTFLGALH